MSKIYNFFANAYECGKMGHAFLIGNVSFLDCKDEIEKVINEFICKKNVPINVNPDVTIVEPITNNISKDQIKSLLQDISTTSQVSGKKVYIITNCESLSDTVYNSLLKTIEEPGDDLYAFLISSNIDAVGDTIKSRCQVVFTSSYKLEERNDEAFRISEKIVKSLENNGIDSIAKNSEVYNAVENKNMFKLVLKEMFNIYMNALYNEVGAPEGVENIKVNGDIKTLCRKVLVVNSLIERNDININKDIAIDKVIIDLWRCNL